MLTITPIASNIILFEDIDVNKNQVVWRTLESGFQDYEIYLFDGNKTIKISDNQTNLDLAPQVDNGQVVWYTNDGNDSEISFYDGTKTIQLTNNTANDDSPQISDGQVLWYQYEALPKESGLPSEAEIYLYNGEKTSRITDNDLDDRNAQFYGRQVVWEGKETVDKGDDYEIFLYDNGQTRKLTDNQTDDTLVTVTDNYVLWNSYNRIENEYFLFSYNGNTTVQLTNKSTYDLDTDGSNIVWIANNEVFLYDGSTTKQITNDGFSKNSVQVSGNKIVWAAYNDNANSYNSEVFLYNGSTIAQLTDNDISEYNLQIDGENIVWEISNFDFITYQFHDDIYIYRNGAASPLANTSQSERILSLSGNTLVGYIDASNDYYRLAEQVFFASWTDDTFPRLENPAQYGASYKDLIETFGYNLEAFNQHYRQFGIAEGRSLDRFDEFRYLASNTDLIKFYGVDGQAATRHYLEYGYRERRPLDTFKADQYIASYSDLIYNFGGGYDYYNSSEPDFAGATRHYVEHGYAEGRDIDTFDEISYLAANPDLIAQFGSDPAAAAKQYIQRGFYEYRPLTFAASRYLASNTDLIDRFDGDRTLATTHYVVSGYNEGRPTDSFDPLQYIASYKDLIVDFGTGGDIYNGYDGINLEAATDHFVDFGYKEKRSTDTFDELRYIASNIDLIYNYNGYYYVDGGGATEHYIRYGSSENRPTSTFDPLAYLQANPDVASAYNNDPTKATIHYIQHGYYEGRSPAPGVSPF